MICAECGEKFPEEKMNRIMLMPRRGMAPIKLDGKFVCLCDECYDTIILGMPKIKNSNDISFGGF